MNDAITAYDRQLKEEKEKEKEKDSRSGNKGHSGKGQSKV